MKVGTETKNLIPSTAKLLESKPTFVGQDPATKKVTVHVEDSFDVDGDGKADIQRRRVLGGSESMLWGDLRSGGKVEKESFQIVDNAKGERVLAEDANGLGKLSSVLTLNWNTHSVSGEKDLNGDGTVDKKVERGVDGRVVISTSTRRDGVFDSIEKPVGGFGW